nr:granulocyte colony-stimulating factor isoform X1 [Anas platyrhynchos]
MCCLTRMLVLVLSALLGAPWRALHGAPLAELSGDQDFQLFLHKNLEFTRKIKGDVAALQRVVCDTFQLCKEEELLLVQQDLRITQVALEQCHRPSFQAVSASSHPCHGQPSERGGQGREFGGVQASPSTADPPLLCAVLPAGGLLQPDPPRAPRLPQLPRRCPGAAALARRPGGDAAAGRGQPLLQHPAADGGPGLGHGDVPRRGPRPPPRLLLPFPAPGRRLPHPGQLPAVPGDGVPGAAAPRPPLTPGPASPRAIYSPAPSDLPRLFNIYRYLIFIQPGRFPPSPFGPRAGQPSPAVAAAHGCLCAASPLFNI